MKVAVISSNKELSRFFEIESLFFGAECVIFEKVRADVLEYDLIVFDADTVKNGASLPIDKLLVVSENEEKQSGFKGVKFVLWPVSVEYLRNIFETVKYLKSDNATQKINYLNTEDRIYFSRDAHGSVRYKGKIISLSDSEKKILLHLCQNAYSAVSRDELKSLLGAEQGNITDVYVCKLRQKLEADSGKRLIYTVRSVGYKIMADMEWE